MANNVCDVKQESLQLVELRSNTIHIRSRSFKFLQKSLGKTFFPSLTCLLTLHNWIYDRQGEKEEEEEPLTTTHKGG